MDAVAWFAQLVADQKSGRPRGICSICSAHEIVLEAGFLQGLRDDLPVLIESTANQVNQLGGYTGTTPEGFRALVMKAAGAMGFPPDRVLLGGDHLGPYPWRTEPAAAALARACDLVEACVRAGYRKLHLDASMALGGDPVDARGALDPRVIAEREAEMAAAAEAAFTAPGPGRPAGSPPVYVIGTEVPAPGGTPGTQGSVSVTRPADLEETYLLCRDAFHGRGLDDAWDRVRAVVAQPGVEFGDQTVHPYDRARAAELCAAARLLPGVVLEGHSTDYQLRDRLVQLVEDGVAVLKVGPALTFALRECLFGLEAIERELIAAREGGAGSRAGSGLSEALERAMLADPAHWKAYYRGSSAEQRLARRYSLSDRSRYYWKVPAVSAATDVLFRNLSLLGIPLTLLSQHLPVQHRAVRDGRIAGTPREMVREGVRRVLDDYSAAVRGSGSPA